MSVKRPSLSALRRGILLGSIVNAVATAKHFDSGVYQHWRGPDYLVDGTDGRYGALCFGEHLIVATFFDNKSERSPFLCQGSYDLNRFFAGMPPSLQLLAQRASDYWQQCRAGAYIPCVTAAFWNAGEDLIAAESWEQVYEHGAHIIRIELLEIAKNKCCDPIVCSIGRSQ